MVSDDYCTCSRGEGETGARDVEYRTWRGGIHVVECWDPKDSRSKLQTNHKGKEEVSTCATPRGSGAQVVLIGVI